MFPIGNGACLTSRRLNWKSLRIRSDKQFAKSARPRLRHLKHSRYKGQIRASSSIHEHQHIRSSRRSLSEKGGVLESKVIDFNLRGIATELKEKFLSVPIYQRSYSWTADEVAEY